jgi:hypothetical protein
VYNLKTRQARQTRSLLTLNLEFELNSTVTLGIAAAFAETPVSIQQAESSAACHFYRCFGFSAFQLTVQRQKKGKMKSPEAVNEIATLSARRSRSRTCMYYMYIVQIIASFNFIRGMGNLKSSYSNSRRISLTETK